ncbi:MAG: hypothetical protein FWD46_08280 [Cystobacterineae bacterium]|nr:hypothetical protein [Cystobacterineae bacterium]
MRIQEKRSGSQRRQGLALGLLLALAITSVGCTSEKTTGLEDIVEQEKNEESENKAGENEEVEIASMLHGMVLDSFGKALRGVRVSSGTVNVTTDYAGKFRIEKPAIVNNRSVIQFEKPGYFTLTRSGVKQEETYLRVMLHPQGNSNTSLKHTFNAQNPTSLTIRGNGAPNAMQVHLQASALARADGSDYTGMATADMVYLDPNNEHFAESMPGGDLAAINGAGNEGVLISYGMVDVNFSDDEGNPLQLKNGSPAQIVFPLPAGMENNPPTSIPLWHFDEEQGVWVEEGVAQRVAGANGTYLYQGEAKHFSWWNLDIYAEPATVEGSVVDCKSKPVPYLLVTGQVIATETATGITQLASKVVAFTNSKGKYSLLVPIGLNYVGADLSYTLDIRVEGNGEIKGGVSGIRLQPGNVTITNDIYVPCIDLSGESGGEMGAFFDIEKGSVGYSIFYDGYYYNQNQENPIISFDNNGERIRVDIINSWNDAISETIIKDGADCFIYADHSGWSNQSHSVYCHGSALGYLEMAKASPYGVFATSCSAEPICSMTSGIPIAGKLCDFYAFEKGSIATSIDDIGQEKQNLAFWNGFRMLHEYDANGIVLLAQSATLAVPTEAFNHQSVPPKNPCDWLPSYRTCPLEWERWGPNVQDAL